MSDTVPRSVIPVWWLLLIFGHYRAGPRPLSSLTAPGVTPPDTVCCFKVKYPRNGKIVI